MSSNLDTAVDLKHYWRIIWRRKGLVLLCTVTTVCAAFITLALVPKEYESQATLMLEDERLLSADLERVMGGIMQAPTGYGADAEQMAKVVGRIRSRPFLEQVIRMLKMNEDPVVRRLAEERCKAHPEVTVDEMAIRILVGNLQSRIRFTAAGTGIYNILVADYSAANAQVLAKWICELFVDTSSQNAVERLKTAHQFGAEQLQIYEQQLRQSEQSLEQYKSSVIQQNLARGIVTADNVFVAEALSRGISNEVASARTRTKPYEVVLSELGLGTDQTAILADPKIQDLVNGLSGSLKNEVVARLAGHALEVGDWPPAGTYGNLHRGAFAPIEAVVASYLPQGKPDAIAAIARYAFSQVDLEAETEAGQMIDGAIADFKREAQSTPEGEITLDRLTADVETNRKLLQSFQAQLVASDVSQAAEMTKLGLQIQILDPARLPLTPSRPDRAKILLAAFFLGPLLGVGLVFVGETLDPTLRSIDDFTKVVPEPILGTTPLLNRLIGHRSWMRRHWIPATVTGLVLLTAVFLVAGNGLVRSIASERQPVRLEDPEGTHDADHR